MHYQPLIGDEHKRNPHTYTNCRSGTYLEKDWKISRSTLCTHRSKIVFTHHIITYITYHICFMLDFICIFLCLPLLKLLKIKWGKNVKKNEDERKWIRSFLCFNERVHAFARKYRYTWLSHSIIVKSNVFISYNGSGKMKQVSFC